MEHKLSYPQGTDEYHHCKQFLHFQMSGQGPYFGQAWYVLLLFPTSNPTRLPHEQSTHNTRVFTHLFPEKLPSVVERYMNEIKRVHSVLEVHLATRDWLVGDRCTYADLAFITWQEIAGILAKENPGYFETERDFPRVYAWYNRMVEKPSLKKLMQERVELMAKAMAAGKH